MVDGLLPMVSFSSVQEATDVVRRRRCRELLVAAASKLGLLVASKALIESVRECSDMFDEKANRASGAAAAAAAAGKLRASTTIES